MLTAGDGMVNGRKGRAWLANVLPCFAPGMALR